MTGARVKRSETWDSGLVVTCPLDTFDLLVLRVILGVVRCTCVKIAINKKTISLGAKLT